MSVTVKFSVQPVGTVMVIFCVRMSPMELSLKFEPSMNVFGDCWGCYI